MSQSNYSYQQSKKDSLFRVAETYYPNIPQPLSADDKTNKFDSNLDVYGNTELGNDQLKKIGPYVTSYVSLLTPRFVEHLLIGDLCDQLYIWIKDICISFGWQLKYLDIKPEYLHWVMAVSINTYPAQFIKIVRRETSIKILDDFPRIKKKNTSNDFWAPWYFVSVGQAPYTRDVIHSLLKQIREQQGYNY